MKRPPEPPSQRLCTVGKLRLRAAERAGTGTRLFAVSSRGRSSKGCAVCGGCSVSVFPEDQRRAFRQRKRSIPSVQGQGEQHPPPPGHPQGPDGPQAVAQASGRMASTYLPCSSCPCTQQSSVSWALRSLLHMRKRRPKGASRCARSGTRRQAQPEAMWDIPRQPCIPICGQYAAPLRTSGSSLTSPETVVKHKGRASRPQPSTGHSCDTKCHRTMASGPASISQHCLSGQRKLWQPVLKAEAPPFLQTSDTGQERTQEKAP